MLFSRHCLLYVCKSSSHHSLLDCLWPNGQRELRRRPTHYFSHRASVVSFTVVMATLFQAGGSRAHRRQRYRAVGHAQMETSRMSDGRLRLALLLALEGCQVFRQGEIRT